MYVECVTSQGSRVVNEDSFYVGNHVALVIDGASGLSAEPYFVRGGVRRAPEQSHEPSTDAHWFAQAIVEHFPVALRAGLDLSAALRRTLAAIRESVSDINVQALQAFEQPSAAAAVVRWNEKEVEYLVMGDCSIIFQNDEGPVQIVTDERVAHFDALAVKAVESLRSQKSLTLTEAKEQVLPLLQANRSKMNQHDGYYILSLDAEGLTHAKTGVYARGSAQTKMLLCSDGFARTVDMFQAVSWDHLLRPEVGLLSALQDLRKIEEGDAQCSEFLRLKVHDDATAVRVVLL